MLKRTRWQPDTCGCVIEYEWDDAVPQEERTHNYVAHVACARHQAASATLATVHSENRRKNEAVEALRVAVPLLRDVEPGFTFTADGIMALRFQGVVLTGQQRTAASAVLARFGGLVTLE